MWVFTVPIGEANAAVPIRVEPFAGVGAGVMRGTGDDPDVYTGYQGSPWFAVGGRVALQPRLSLTADVHSAPTLGLSFGDVVVPQLALLAVGLEAGTPALRGGPFVGAGLGGFELGARVSSQPFHAGRTSHGAEARVWWTWSPYFCASVSYVVSVGPR